MAKRTKESYKKAGEKAARTRRRNKKLGLSGPDAKDSLLKEAATPVAIIVGAALGTVSSRLLDGGFKVDEFETEGKFNFRKLLGPAIVIGVGAGAAIAGRQMKQKFIKNLGIGFIAGGTINGINIFIKKDLLKGVGATKQEQLKILEETEKEIATLLEQNEEFAPDLPRLNEAKDNLDPENLSPEDQAQMGQDGAFANDLYQDPDQETVL